DLTRPRRAHEPALGWRTWRVERLSTRWRLYEPSGARRRLSFAERRLDRVRRGARAWRRRGEWQFPGRYHQRHHEDRQQRASLRAPNELRVRATHHNESQRE